MDPVHTAVLAAKPVQALHLVDGRICESELGEMLTGGPLPDHIALAVNDVNIVVENIQFVDTGIFCNIVRKNQHLAVFFRLHAGGA